jgi:hypothetical protein
VPVLAGWVAVLAAVGSLAGRGVLARQLRGCADRGRTAAWTALSVVVAVGVVMRPRYYASGPWADLSDLLGVAAGLLTATSVALWAHPPAGRRPAVRWLATPACFWSVAGLVAGAGVAMILAAPAPRIDVFHLLQVSSRGLAHGADMYRQQWAPRRADYPVDGLFDVYPYLPGTTLLLAPFRLLLGDVRYGLLLALVLAAATVRRLAPAADAASPAGTPLALPLLLLVFPGSLYALQQSWTEPLLIACLAGMVRAVATGRTRWAVVAFALALASKQHIALLVPVAAAWPAFGPRRALSALGAAAVLIAPWVLAGPSDFWADAVLTNLGYPVRGDALSIPGVLSHAGVTAGFAPMVVALVCAYGLAWRVRGDAAGFCAGAAVLLLTLDVMNKQSYFNHYTLPMALLVMAVVLGGPTAAPVPGRPERAAP